MAHTLRRSRSKYGRTRRQRRKQRRMRGGGIFNDFINKFKPATPEEKCENAKQAAEEVCSSVSAPSSEPVVEQQSGDELSPPSELDSLVPENQLENPDSVAAMSDMSPSYPEDIAATPALNTEMMPPPNMSEPEPVGMMPPPSMSEPVGVGMEQKSLTQQQPPPLPMQTVNFGGSRRKNKKKNKKQSRRKKRNLENRKNDYRIFFSYFHIFIFFLYFVIFCIYDLIYLSSL